MIKQQIKINNEDWKFTVHNDLDFSEPYIDLELGEGYSTSLKLTKKGIVIVDISQSSYHSFEPTPRSVYEWFNIIIEAHFLIQRFLK